MKDELNYELLANVAHIIMGQSPPSSTYNTVGEGLPFYQGKTDFGDMYPTPRVYCTEPSRIAEPDDILISVRAPVGPTNISRERSCIGRGISAIRAGKNIDRDFLLYFLRFYEPELAKAGTGSTFAAIAREDLETIKIPLPPLTEQKRIASLLARADRLRSLRRTAHDLGESLLQSVFLEMFGDPVENTKHWQRFELGEIASVERGRFSPRPRNDPKYYGGKYPFIQTGDISASGGIVTQYSQTLNELGIKVSKAFDVGTIVIAVVGATIGESAILGIKTYCPDSIIGIIPNPKKCNAQYLEFVMRHWKPVFRAQAPETARANINIGIVKPIPVPVPPLSLQEEFAGVVARVESLRRRMSEAGRQVNGLFESLLHEAFNA